MKSGRKDHKNRLLREGESQNKDGRYRYSYYENGKQKSLVRNVGHDTALLAQHISVPVVGITLQ